MGSGFAEPSPSTITLWNTHPAQIPNIYKLKNIKYLIPNNYKN
jgi:hypothetical protein